MGLCSCIALCCAALLVLPGNLLADEANPDRPSTGGVEKLPSPQPKTSELPSFADDPYEAPEVPEYEEEEDYLVRYEDGRLTVDVLDMPLNDLLTEVGRQGGARVRAEGLEKRTVTDRFTRLPLDEALRRLVVGKNFSIIYSEQKDQNGQALGTRLKELQVYGGTGSVSTYQPPSKSKGSARPTAAGPAARRPATARAPVDPKPEKASKSKHKKEEVEPEEKPARAEAPDEEPREFANPVTAAILGGRRAPREEDLPLNEELLVPDEGLQQMPEDTHVLPEELDEEPAVEDVWYPDLDAADVHDDVHDDVDDEGEYEDDGYN